MKRSRSTGEVKSKKGVAHVVLGNNCLLCNNCGATQSLAIDGGMSIGAWSGLCRGFEKEHARCKPDPDRVAKKRAFATPWEWYERSQDTGISSLTIAHVLAGVPLAQNFGAGIPHDPSDFGRCLRVVRAFNWRPRLGEVAARFPFWKPLVDSWDAMEALYDEEEPTGSAPRLYDLMRTLNDASDKIRGFEARP